MDAPGDEYRRTRERLTALLAAAGDGAADHPVPACPGWDVRAVVAHLVGTVEDARAGRLSGPPPPAVTAEQVARHRHRPLADLLQQWADLAPPFEDAVTAAEIWPAVVDVVSHEHDVRGALDLPGARDDALVVDLAHRLAGGLAVAVDLDGARVGPADAPLVLRTTPFELLRLRLGRRSRDQVRALDWSGDPAPVLDALFVFGPRPDALVE